MTKRKKKFIGAALSLVMSIGTIGFPIQYAKIPGIQPVIASAAYVTGRYQVNVIGTLNIRSGAGTNYSIKGGTTNGVQFVVTKISENWGYTDSIQCKDGTVQSGWVSLLYCSYLGAVTLGTETAVKQETYVTPLENRGIYYLSPACAPGCVVDIAEASQNNCANALMWQKQCSPNQQFKIIKNEDGSYVFSAVHSGKVLDIQGGSARDGANVIQYTDRQTDNQAWYLYDAGDDYYYIKSKKNQNYCLNVYGGGSRNGTDIRIWHFNPSDNALKFRFVRYYPFFENENVSSMQLGIQSYSTEYRNSRFYRSAQTAPRTGANRGSLVNIARSQIGYHEGSYAGDIIGNNNLCEYNRWYYASSKAYGTDYAWCAVFINWCMRQVNVPVSVYPDRYYNSKVYTQRVGAVKTWFSSRGRYESYSSYTPKPGDIAIFTDAKHIGIVEKYSGVGSAAVITTVEGNTGDAVLQHTYYNDGKSIIGFCIPNY